MTVASELAGTPNIGFEFDSHDLRASHGPHVVTINHWQAASHFS